MRIFVDLEATEGGEILAIGAVTDNDSRFFAVVKPEFTKLTPRIMALTGYDEQTMEGATDITSAVYKFVQWSLQWVTAGVHFFTFGKNDREFIQKTRDLHFNAKGMSELVHQLDWIKGNMSNGASPIYSAFKRPLISLRSAYYTYKNTPSEGAVIHNPVEDAVMFKELVEAAEGGWKLPADAEIVKVSKPVLPPKDANNGMGVPEDLNRKVIAYWQRGGKERVQLYPNLISAAKSLCTQAIQIDHVSPEQAAYRLLNAAITGDSYCNRKFFLVD